jgi:hypothetical protein
MRALVLTLEEELDWHGNAPLTTYFEEGYLMRRGRATLRAVLAGRVYGGVRTQNTGAATLDELLSVHKGRVVVVAFLLIGEVQRLVDYREVMEQAADPVPKSRLKADASGLILLTLKLGCRSSMSAPLKAVAAQTQRPSTTMQIMDIILLLA